MVDLEEDPEWPVLDEVEDADNDRSVICHTRVCQKYLTRLVEVPIDLKNGEMERGPSLWQHGGGVVAWSRVHESRV